jgi:hypothetical protein
MILFPVGLKTEILAAKLIALIHRFKGCTALEIVEALNRRFPKSIYWYCDRPYQRCTHVDLCADTVHYESINRTIYREGNPDDFGIKPSSLEIAAFFEAE